MKDMYSVDTKVRRTRIGVYLMLTSFVMGMIVAVGWLLSMGGILDTDAMGASPLGVPTILVSLLTPWAIIFEVVAVVLVLLDSRLVGGLHRRLALTALWFLIAWGVMNVGGFLPLTFMAVQRGSLGMLRAGQIVKAVAAIFQYAIPFLLVFGIALPRTRKLLWIALVLTLVGNFATVIMGGTAMELQALETPGAVSYVPRLVVDYTKGIYPVLLALGYAGGLAYIVAYVSLVTRMNIDLHDVAGSS